MRQAYPNCHSVPIVSGCGEATSSLIDRAPFGICRLSLRHDRVKSANPALCEMLGYSEGELRGLSIARQLYANAPNRHEICLLYTSDAADE